MKNKIIDILIIALIYCLMFASYIFLNSFLNINDIIIKLFVVAIIWTIYLWLFGLLFKNIFVYQLFWYIGPLFFVLVYLKKITELNAQSYLIVGCLGFWTIKSVINLLIRFQNFSIKDWRQTYFENKYQKKWFLFNLFCCHIIPTIIIYFAIIPIFYYIDFSTTMNINLSTMIGLLIMGFGVIIEMVSDQQMNRFKRKSNNPSEINRIGLWKNSRHPNYLGEIMVWWGAYLMMLSLVENKFLLFLGPLLVTLLILIISIPLVEKREKELKPEYEEYIENTNMLLIFPKKSKSV